MGKGQFFVLFQLKAKNVVADGLETEKVVVQIPAGPTFFPVFFVCFFFVLFKNVNSINPD